MYKQYNTRHSGRYNNPGQFIPAGETQQQQQQYQPQQQQQEQQQQPPLPPPPMPVQTLRQPNLRQLQMEDIEMKPDVTNNESVSTNGDDSARPPWMKNKLAGVRKISNKERRRRQNESLRRLISPKNALMVLNEMMPNEQVAQQFKVEPAQVNNHFSYKPSASTFCADLNIEGQTYKGFGENKLAARNTAAEQAIRDIIIKKMTKALSHEQTASGAGGADGASGAEEESLPMIQLASFALHKLFSEWEYEGHKVPMLKPSAGPVEAALDPTGGAGSNPPLPKAEKPAKPRALPPAAATMHPAMLLSHMRPGTQYAELAHEGHNAQTMNFTMGVDVDGKTYIGKAGNKKEARRLAARAACQVLFGIQYTD